MIIGKNCHYKHTLKSQIFGPDINVSVSGNLKKEEWGY